MNFSPLSGTSAKFCKNLSLASFHITSFPFLILSTFSSFYFFFFSFIYLFIYFFFLGVGNWACELFPDIRKYDNFPKHEKFEQTYILCNLTWGFANFILIPFCSGSSFVSFCTVDECNFKFFIFLQG